jgi:fumarate reductase subunit C
MAQALLLPARRGVMAPRVEHDERPAYTEFQPRWYRPRISTYWWLQRRSHFTFILRELSSIFVAWFVVFLLLLVAAVSRGEESYRQFLDWSGSPVVVVFNLVSLLFVVFHTVTWFNLAPQAVAVRLRGKRVPGTWVAASNYVAWAVVSALVAWLLLSG